MACRYVISLTSFQGTPRDVAQLHTAIDRRVIALKRNQNQTVIDTTATYNSNKKAEEDTQSDGLASGIIIFKELFLF